MSVFALRSINNAKRECYYFPPGPKDSKAFEGFKLNIIVGAFGSQKTDNYGKEISRTKGAAFYDKNTVFLGKLSRTAINKMLSKTKK